MYRKMENQNIAEDIEAVVTSYNQGSMILEAVSSLCNQTMLPAGIIIVDDGSTEKHSLEILDEIASDPALPVPVTVLHQSNGGVSAARNAGISRTRTSMVLVLDGDDKLESAYIEETGRLLRSDPTMVAASSWMCTFGVLDSVVRPSGGKIGAFLSRNCCPATHILRRRAWELCGGYDESMRSGFEDWDFFLSMLETDPEAHIGIVEIPLIDYRTAPASSNVRSMSKRLDLMRFIIEKHMDAYKENVADAVLGIESVSMFRLYGWESEISHTLDADCKMCEASEKFMEHPSYGDGGMAAAVRIMSAYDKKGDSDLKQSGRI